MKTSRLLVSMTGPQPVNTPITTLSSGLLTPALGALLKYNRRKQFSELEGPRDTGFMNVCHHQRKASPGYRFPGGGRRVHLGRVLVAPQFFGLFEGLISIFLRKKKERKR